MKIFSKLLATLDNAVVTDSEAVGRAVIDKAYMIQLVEVQHKRGAVGGTTFTRALCLQEHNKQIPIECQPFVFKKGTLGFDYSGVRVYNHL